MVAQREHAVTQPGKVRHLCQQLARAAPCVVRGLAITKGAEHEQRLCGGLQLRGSHARERQYLHPVAGRLQLCCRTPGQLFGEAALAGMHHQPRCACGVGCCFRNGLPQCARGALAATAVQVQQPAGDEEQAHAQAAEHHHDAPGHAEEAARVQGEHAGGELAAGTLACVRTSLENRAGGRVELQQVVRTIMVAAALRGIRRHHPHIECLAGLLRQAQVDEALAHTGQRIQRGLDIVQIQGQIRGESVFGGGRDTQQLGQPVAVPVERPPQPGQRAHQVDQQHPGTDHRMQAPQEAAARACPLHGQPAAPLPPATWPAQVQPGQGEEQQGDRTAAGDPRAALAGNHMAVQVLDEIEESLSAQRAEALTAVGVEIHPVVLATGKACDRRPLAAGIHPQTLQRPLAARLQQRHQFTQRERLLVVGMVFGDRGETGVGRTQQLILERQDRTAQAHHGQDGTRADAQQPVQLEQDVLEHRDRGPSRLPPASCATANEN
ncbi:hypothetical protein D3C73_847380 [compost metagenome]